MKMDELQAITKHLGGVLSDLDLDGDLDAISFRWVRVGTTDTNGRSVDVTVDPSGNVTVNPQAKHH